MRSPLVHPTFIDHNPYSPVTSGFVVTNEEPEVFEEMLGKQRFPRVACIASAGEILIGSLLKRSDMIVAVDHSYLSLSACYAKLLALQKESPKLLAVQLRNNEYATVSRTFNKYYDHLPTPVIDTLKKQHYGYRTLGDGNKWYFSDEYRLQELRREWAPRPLPRVTKRDVGKVTLIHGDLTDVSVLYPEPFDLFYASNAMEHDNRDRQRPTISIFATALKVGGLLMLTTAGTDVTNTLQNAGFEVIHKFFGVRSQWTHWLAKKVR